MWSISVFGQWWLWRSCSRSIWCCQEVEAARSVYLGQHFLGWVREKTTAPAQLQEELGFLEELRVWGGKYVRVLRFRERLPLHSVLMLWGSAHLRCYQKLTETPEVAELAALPCHPQMRWHHLIWSVVTLHLLTLASVYVQRVHVGVRLIAAGWRRLGSFTRGYFCVVSILVVF